MWVPGQGSPNRSELTGTEQELRRSHLTGKLLLVLQHRTVAYGGRQETHLEQVSSLNLETVCEDWSLLKSGLADSAKKLRQWRLSGFVLC